MAENRGVSVPDEGLSADRSALADSVGSVAETAAVPLGAPSVFSSKSVNVPVLTVKSPAPALIAVNVADSVTVEGACVLRANHENRTTPALPLALPPSASALSNRNASAL